MTSTEHRKDVSCPVCSKAFPEKLINSHVNECLNSPNEVHSLPVSKKRKSDGGESDQTGWSFLMSKKTNAPLHGSVAKRCKMNPSVSSRKNYSASEKDDIICIEDEIGMQKKSTFKDASAMSSNSIMKGMLETQMNSKEVRPADQEQTTECHIDLSIPLAEQMRPSVLEEYIGQEKALGSDKMLAKLLRSDAVPSMILWGPPGCGKTTLAKIIARKCKSRMKFVQLSATSSGVNDVKEVVKNAKNDFKMFRKRTILFLDEIHRFNKLQQDSLLPHIEDGTITLIGATTENPSFQVNNALLSRCRVIVLERLDSTAVMKILVRAAQRLGFGVVEEDSNSQYNQNTGKFIEKQALEFLCIVCDGDARIALNGLQISVQQARCSQDEEENKPARLCIRTEDIKESLQRSHVAYDKTGEEHYNMISALHKSMRGGDDSAALYWTARMMEGGEDPIFIARRLIEFASCDIGLADPHSLSLAVSTFQAVQFIGKPECEKPLAQCVVYLARAPKSVEVTTAYGKAKACVLDHNGPLPSVPLHLRNASTKLMKSLGYGKGYSHNPGAKLNFFPDNMAGTNFFR